MGLKISLCSFCFDCSSREEKFAGKLEKEGHKCIFYLETIPSQISWCGNRERCLLFDVKDEDIINHFFKIKRVFL